MKKGISLIILVITIIVILILAGAVILSLSQNNPIANSKQSVFKATVDSYKSELAITLANKYAKNNVLDINTFDAGVWDGSASTSGTVKEYIASISAADGLKFEIQYGKLVYIGNDVQEKTWLTDIGIANTTERIYVTNKADIPSSNKHKTPYIPSGFTYKEGIWDIGLVIQDASGNEFVWIPVDGVNVPYAKWCTTTNSYNNINISDDTLPSGVYSESAQISDFGGFYISRYEAGILSGNLISKKGATTCNNLNYTDSKTKAESMYNTAFVKSGLLTGTQWDTTLEWIKDSGKSVTDTRSWGNHSDAIAPANVNGLAPMTITGFSEFWKANNIYDLSGNSWEWTSELYSTSAIIRGGGYAYGASGITNPVASRVVLPKTTTHVFVSFRVALYVL